MGTAHRSIMADLLNVTGTLSFAVLDGKGDNASLTVSRDQLMNGNRLLTTGLVGTAVAALCCFTPLLVVTLGAVGLSAMLGWLDFVLIPALLFFAGLTLYALVKRHRTGAEAPKP